MTELPMTELMQALVPVLGRALLHFLWQGTVIGLVAAAALQFLRNARPQTRYAVACAALLACLLAPAMYIVAQVGATPDVAVPTSMAAPAVFTALATQPAPALDAWSIGLDAGLPLIVALWAAGACVPSLRMAMGVVWLGRLRATPQGPAHAAWQARLDARCAVLGVHRPVALRLVDSIDSPASAGWWRPVVLLPTALIARMPHELIEALLAHELAHIRRHDYLVNLMQGVVEALLFYHPVTWWLSRQIRNEREHIADGLAAEATGEPRRLAFALSELSELLSQPHLSNAHHTSFHLAQAAHGGHLMSRIEKLVRPDRKSNGGRLAFPVLGLAAACLAFYAHAQVTKPALSTPAVSTPAVSTPAVATPAVAAPATVKPAAAQYSQAVAKAGSGNMIRLRDDAPQDAYALIRKGQHGFTMSGSSDDIDEIRAAQHSLSEDFIWFRRADKAYVIVDPAIVARAQAAWRDSDKLGASMEALGQQMETHGDKMEAIGEKMERLSVPHGQSAAMQAASQRMEAFGKQQAALGAKQAALAASMANGDEAQQRSLDQQMDALSRQQDALARQMDEQARVLDAESDRMEAQMKPMEGLSRQMEEASKPMDALGKQMDA
ncbi:MAG TPA: M56 family metallopeptidase, partial [Lysobacter sp.]